MGIHEKVADDIARFKRLDFTKVSMDTMSRGVAESAKTLTRVLSGDETPAGEKKLEHFGPLAMRCMVELESKGTITGERICAICDDANAGEIKPPLAPDDLAAIKHMLLDKVFLVNAIMAAAMGGHSPF